ncbi:MAG: NAD-dependent epimerase/dehydratase family protein [Candidatus Kuenenia sp.]|nr:NAD-dependent epimerase/dehydratase family protein [Candidatus Kuenenia hertensis]
MTFSGQKVLVTGASGFIGFHLCQSLIRLDAQVYGISRKSKTNFESNIHWCKGDLADLISVRRLLTTIKPDIIFHLASYVSGSRDLKVVLPVFNSNLLSTINILAVSTEIGFRRIILAGSLEEPETGDFEAIPASPYAAAKMASSAYARMFHALYQTPVVIARLFMVYGPRQQDLRKLIPYVTLSLLSKQAPKLSSGRRQVDWIYIDDVVSGLLSMAHAPNVEGHTIELGSGTLVTIRNVVKQLVNITESNVKPLFGSIPDRPMEQVRIANTAKTYDEIGWKPMTTLEKGLEYTVNWYRKHLTRVEGIVS